MLRKLCLSVVGLLLAIVAFAQTPLASPVTIEQTYDSLYQAQTVRMCHTFWSGYKLYIDDIEYPLKHISAIGKPYQAVMSEYDNFASCRKKKNIFMTLSFVLESIGLAVCFKKDPSQSDYVFSTAFIGGALIGTIIGGVYEGKSINHMEKTVWLYNREVMRPYILNCDTVK